MAKKSIRITSKNHDHLWAQKDSRIQREAHLHDNDNMRNSTGVHSKDKEIVIRDMVNKEGITWSGDLRSRSWNKDDIYTSDAQGHEYCLEVKHGGGALAYASKYGLEKFESRDRDLCLLGVNYVIYHKNATEVSNDRHEIADEYLVASREDFLDMLEEYCHGIRKAGWETAVKFGNADHDTINIQSQYLEEFYNGLLCELGARTMSLYEFCVTILGREPRWS